MVATKRLEKDVLWPGVVHPPGRPPERFHKSRIEHLLKRANEMIAAKQPIPLAWEHQKDATPAQRSKEHIAFLQSFRLDNKGHVVAEFEAEDATDEKQLRKVRYVSPAIRTNFEDGTGRVWPGESIIHVAVTPRPVQTNQEPFREAPATNGLALSHYEGNTLYLSLGDLEMAEDTEDTEATAEEEAASSKTPEAGDSKFKAAVAALAGLGLVLAEDVTPDTFYDHIMTAAETKKASVEGPPADEPDLEDAQVPNEVGRTVAMSLETATERLAKLERADLGRRINRLAQTGRIQKPAADKLRKQLESVELSFGEDGAPAQTPLVAKIEAYEELPANGFKKPTGSSDDDVDLSHAKAVPLSDAERHGDKAPETKKETQSALKEWDATPAS